jgi:hypothetical protein
MSDWQNGLFSCLDSGEIFLFTCCFPFCWRVKYREWVEKEKGIAQPGFIVDCLITHFFGPCSMAQECREIGAYTPSPGSMARE